MIVSALWIDLSDVRLERHRPQDYRLDPFRRLAADEQAKIVGTVQRLPLSDVSFAP
jgi:hypothetical protein